MKCNLEEYAIVFLMVNLGISCLALTICFCVDFYKGYQIITQLKIEHETSKLTHKERD